MALAGVFSGVAGVMIYFLYLCWLRYWFLVRRAREVAVELSQPGVRPFTELQLLYVRQEELLEQEEALHTRYHWCLLLGSVFFGLAAFCAVLHWTEEWPFWIHLPLSVLGGLAALLGCGYLGYGIVREKILPLESGTVEDD